MMVPINHQILESKLLIHQMVTVENRQTLQRVTAENQQIPQKVMLANQQILQRVMQRRHLILLKRMQVMLILQRVICLQN